MPESGQKKPGIWQEILTLIPVLDAYLLSLGGGFAYSSASIREARSERQEAIKGSTSLSVAVSY